MLVAHCAAGQVGMGKGAVQRQGGITGIVDRVGVEIKVQQSGSRRSGYGIDQVGKRRVAIGGGKLGGGQAERPALQHRKSNAVQGWCVVRPAYRDRAGQCKGGGVKIGQASAAIVFKLGDGSGARSCRGVVTGILVFETFHQRLQFHFGQPGMGQGNGGGGAGG